MLSLSDTVFSLFGRPICLIRKLHRYVSKSNFEYPSLADIEERMSKCKKLAKIHRVASLSCSALLNIAAAITGVSIVYEHQYAPFVCLSSIVVLVFLETLSEWRGLSERYSSDLEFFSSMKIAIMSNETLTGSQLLEYCKKSERIDFPVLQRDLCEV